MRAAPEIRTIFHCSRAFLMPQTVGYALSFCCVLGIFCSLKIRLRLELSNFIVVGGRL